jgi:thiamine transporter ThiT
MSNKNALKKLALAGLFLCLGIILPFVTAQIKEIGDTLLPMHIPVMLCGLICGWQYGVLVGVLVPLMRSVMFSVPPIYPNAIWMALELATYGLVIAIMYKILPKKNTATVVLSLVTAQIAGRIVWGLAKSALLGIGGKPFSFEMFLVGGFLDSWIGILLQLILVPTVIEVIKRTKRNT